MKDLKEFIPAFHSLDADAPDVFYSYSCFRFGFIGNQPFSTRSRCSNISLIVQKEEKEKTPNKEEIRMSLISTVPIMPAMPSTKNIHQHRVPQ